MQITHTLTAGSGALLALTAPEGTMIPSFDYNLVGYALAIIPFIFVLHSLFTVFLELFSYAL